MAKAKPPLTESDLDALNKLIRSCEETEQHCAQCEACNLDVDPERQKNRDQLETARKIKATYFPTAV